MQARRSRLGEPADVARSAVPLALIVLRPGLVVKVDGACLTELADQHLPVLEEIVRSITQR